MVIRLHPCMIMSTPPLHHSSFSVWSVKTRRAPSRHCRDAMVYHHTTAAMHDMSTLPLSFIHPPSVLRCSSVGCLCFQPMSVVERVRNFGRKNSDHDVSQPAIAINPESRLGRCWPMKGKRFPHRTDHLQIDQSDHLQIVQTDHLQIDQIDHLQIDQMDHRHNKLDR